MKHGIEELKKLNEQIESVREEKKWESVLDIDTKGNCTNTISNYIAYLTESPKYKGKFKYNDFTKQKEFCGREFNDFDLNILYNDIERDLGLTSHVKIDSALMEVFNINKYNPIIDYLNIIKWDGQERVERLFIDLLDVIEFIVYHLSSVIWLCAAE